MTETKLELDVDDLTVLIFSAHTCASIGATMMEKLRADNLPSHVSEMQLKDNSRMLTKLLKMYEQLTGDFFPHRL